VKRLGEEFDGAERNSIDGCASESASPAADGGDASAAAVAVTSPLGTMLARHVLRDGEVVLLAVKPSVLFVPLVCMKYAAVVLILMIFAQIFNAELHYHARTYHEIGVFLLAARLAVATLQWIGRLYILTDMRVIEVSGVFNAEVRECPLRKVARTRLIHTFRERMLFLGSVEVIPFDESYPVMVWQMVSRPKEIQKTIISAVRRAKQGLPM
jgi:hypothetical protein